MTKFNLFTVILLTAISCSSRYSNKDNTLLNQILSDLDTLTLEESQKMYLEQYDNLNMVFDWMEYDSDSESQTYTEEEERENITNPIRLTSTPLSKEDIRSMFEVEHGRFEVHVISDKEKEFLKNKNTAELSNEKLPITSKLDIRIKNSKNLAESYSYSLKNIYYTDGSVKPVDIKTNNFQDFDLDNFQQIDSVTLHVTYKYPGHIVEKIISSKDKEVNFAGGTISLLKIDNNIAKFKIDESISGQCITYLGKTKLKNLVQSNQSSSSTMSKNDADKFKTSAKKYLGRIADNIKKEKYRDKESFVADIVDAFDHIYMPKKNDQYTTAAFKGNLEEIHLYFAENFETNEFEITLPVEERLFNKNNLVNIQNGSYDKPPLKFIIDQEKKILTKVPDNKFIHQINNYFYEMSDIENVDNTLANDYVMYKLDSIKGLVKMDNNLIVRRENIGEDFLITSKNGKLGAIDRYGNMVIPAIYKYIFSPKGEKIIIASINNDKYTIYDFFAKKINSGNGYVDDFNEGLALVTLSDETGYIFINNKGQTVINLRGYDIVYGFSDGLALVKKNGKVGYIDKTGKVIIPLIYSEGNNFATGITMIRDQKGEYGLINKKNEVVLPFDNYYLMGRSGEGEDVTYTFNDKEYDSYGKLIEKKEAE